MVYFQWQYTSALLSSVYSQWITSARAFVSNSLWTCVERNPECTTLNVEHSSVTSRDKTTNHTWWRPDLPRVNSFVGSPQVVRSTLEIVLSSIGNVYPKKCHESHHTGWSTAGGSLLGPPCSIPITFSENDSSSCSITLSSFYFDSIVLSKRSDIYTL